MSTSNLLSPLETSQRLRISEKTLEKWRITGGGPRFSKVGGRVFYPEDELEAWLRGRIHASTSERAK